MTRLTLDPQTGLLVRRPKGYLETPSPRPLLLGDDAPSEPMRRADRHSVGEWVERSRPHPVSGNKILWRERTIGPGTIERHFTNPSIAER